MTNHAAAKAGLKQETIAIAAVGLTMLGTMLFTTTRLEARIERIQAETREEARADREAISERFDRLHADARADREAISERFDRLHAEARTDREAFFQRMDRIQAETRAEAQSDREAFFQEIGRIRTEAQSDREAFSQEILRLTANHARLAGVVEGPRVE